MRFSWVIASGASYNQMNIKKGINAWIMNYKKHMQHGHKDACPVTLSFTQKSDLQTGHLQTGHLSEDRSFAWNLGYIEKTALCLCGVF